MAKLDELERVLFEDRASWRAWLEEHHERSPGIWLVQWKKPSGRPVLPYDHLVEEALCFGWIDSQAGSVDDDRSRLLLTPRKKGSGWSRPNKERWARLTATGRTHPAGEAVVAAARADGSWSLLDEVEDLVVPDDLGAAFDAHPGSREHWDAFPPSARRAILQWIVLAKRPPTRAKRIEETATLAAQGMRANQWPRT